MEPHTATAPGFHRGPSRIIIRMLLIIARLRFFVNTLRAENGGRVFWKLRRACRAGDPWIFRFIVELRRRGMVFYCGDLVFYP